MKQRGKNCMAFKKQYTEKDIETLVQMWGDGYTATEVGNAIGKSMASVRQFIHRNRKKYDLEVKEGGRYVPRKTFEKQWSGPVIFGHWMITKPWGKATNA